MVLSLTQRGSTLVEALIATLVLSIGLLGVAGLQLLSLQSNQAAYQRAQATLLAADLLDRMRANPVAVSRGYYDRDFGDPRPLAHIANNAGGQRDLADWLRRVELILPPGAERARRPDAQIERIADEVIVALRWDDSRGRARLAQYSARSRL